MRVERLAFERYGIFADRVLSFEPGAALHIVLGANEAGKTSALSAVGDLLFGFGARTTYDFRHDSSTLRIGGRFRHSDGREIVARRRKGNRNTLVDDNDLPLPDDLFSPLLAGMSREEFDSEFGLTATALRDGGIELLKAGGRMAETLAASSAGMAALSRIKERLRSEADNLFTPRRSAGKPFYVMVDRREAADSALRDAIVTRDSVRQAEAAVQDAKIRLNSLSAEHSKVGGILARWRRTLRARSHLARLDSIAEALTGLSDLPDVPAPRLSEWRAGLEAFAECEREIAKLDIATAADTDEIAKLAVDEALLLEGIAIDALRERLGAVRKSNEDLPRRRQARDVAQATLDDAARRLGLPSHVELIDKLPTDLALAHVRDLIDQVGLAEKAAVNAELLRARAEQERDSLAAQDVQAYFGDIDQLRQRFNALGDVPAQAERLRRELSALNVEAEELAAVIASLDPSPGAPDRLRAIPLPDGAVIAKYANAVALGEDETKRLSDMILAADDTIAAIEAELAQLSSAGTVPTRTDVMRARRARDEQIERLHATLGSDRLERERELGALEHFSHNVDNLTDLLLSDIERATRQEAAQLRLVASRNDRGRVEATLRRVQAALAEIDSNWTQVWAPSGLKPRGPADMVRWRERVDDVLNRLRKRDAQKAEIGALVASLEAGKAAVVAFLENAGRNPDHGLSADILYREAKSHFEGLQTAWAETKARSVAMTRAERDLTEAKAAREAAQAELIGHARLWPQAMSDIGLPSQAAPGQADAALAVWQSVHVPRAVHESESHRVDAIEGDLRAFDHDVFEVVDRVAPELRGSSAQESLARLVEKLARARHDSDACRRLRESAAKRASVRHDHLVTSERLAVVLNEGCAILGVPGMKRLSAAVERIAERHQLESERAKLRRELHEIADTLDERTLRQEREGVNFDLLPGEIERGDVRQKQLLQDVAKASAVHHQAQTDLDVLTKGRNAAAAAAERAEVNAELLVIAERWLLRAAASQLAARAIERHRVLVQDPLIMEAGRFFATATDDSFAGLGIDYSDDDQPILVARRAEGELVRIEGLSEGTRDQLFLALRLALLEHRPSEPMPFIGDDLLTSFDERRTFATLRLLASAGQRRQIILFTHHRHVAELAKSIQDQMIDIVYL